MSTVRLLKSPVKNGDSLAVRDAVAKWYLVAKSMVSQLYNVADDMEREIPSELHEFMMGLELADSALMNFSPDVGVTLPNPMATIRDN